LLALTDVRIFNNR